MRTNAKAIRARLAARKRLWAWDDRQRGTSTYRSGKLYRHAPKPAKAESLCEAVVLIGVLTAALLLAV